MPEKIRARVLQRIYEIVPSEETADTPGEFHTVREIAPNEWEAEYRIPMVVFGPGGAENSYESYVFKIDNDLNILSEEKRG